MSSDPIQLHDATLVDLRVLAGGRVVMRFEGVTVYRPVAPELYDTWIHGAKLVFGGVTHLAVVGPPWIQGDDDYVLGDKVISSLGEEVHWAEIGKEEVRKVELLIFSGARIEVLCSSARLTLSRKGIPVGQWRGVNP